MIDPLWVIMAGCDITTKNRCGDTMIDPDDINRDTTLSALLAALEQIQKIKGEIAEVYQNAIARDLEQRRRYIKASELERKVKYHISKKTRLR
jgi:hypothetical protein